MRRVPRLARVLVALLVTGVAGSGAAQTTRALTPAAFLALVDRYRHGDLTSLSEAGEFTPRHVARAVAAAGAADQATARAALVFTIDLTRIVPLPEVAGLIDASRALAEAVTRNSQRAFIREVVLCQLASLAHADEFDRAQSLIDAASHTWREDPELLLARGSLYETAFERGSRAPLGNRHGVTEYESIALERLAQMAVAHFERVLTSPVPQPEARLRLGKLLTLRQKYDDAKPMLERARTDSTQPYLRYLASLFLGQLHERLAQYPEAERAYRAAYGEYPAQAVTLSLVRLLILRGAHTDSDALLLTMFETRRSSTAPVDPWRLYEFGQFWQLGQRLDHLRPLIR